MARKKEIASEKDVRRKLHVLRREGRERYLKLMGIDVGRVRSLEKDIDAGYDELDASVQEMTKEAGRETADMHQKSLERSLSMIQRNAEVALAGPVSVVPGLERYPGPFKLCPCIYPFTASPAPPPQDSIDLDPSNGDGATGSVTYNAANNVAHPRADTKGKGTGTINTATVTTKFRFSFMPTTDRTYCIHPIVHMNGHWLVWTWGTCAGTAEDLGSGTVRATLRVRVDQLSLTVKQIEHKVFEQTAANGQDFWSGFGYDSEVDGGAAMTVALQGGHEAVVWVECESYAQIANHGRARVDMQTSSFYYFKVPEVRWGWRSCWPWWWAIPLEATPME